MQPCASYQLLIQNHLLHLRDLELSVAMVYVDCPKAFFKLSQIMDKSASEVKPLINVFSNDMSLILFPLLSALMLFLKELLMIKHSCFFYQETIVKFFKRNRIFHMKAFFTCKWHLPHQQFWQNFTARANFGSKLLQRNCSSSAVRCLHVWPLATTQTRCLRQKSIKYFFSTLF